MPTPHDNNKSILPEIFSNGITSSYKSMNNGPSIIKKILQLHVLNNSGMQVRFNTNSENEITNKDVFLKSESTIKACERCSNKIFRGVEVKKDLNSD